MTKGRRTAAALAGAGALALALAGCAGSHIHPSLGEYAITTSHGYFSNQDVISAARPGQNVKLGSGTTTWYFPANVRSYVTGPDGDRPVPTAEFTGATPKQANSAISAHVYTYVGWEVNPAITTDNKGLAVDGVTKIPWAFASHFLNLCLKYACATQHPQNSTANSQKERSSDPGWLNMVDELFPRAIDNATRAALVQFPPSIWEAAGEGDWPRLADMISANLSAELQALDGSRAEGQPDYFCGPGSTTTDCKPFLVQVSNILPTDQGIVTAYQLEQQAVFAAQAATARLAVAEKLYGPDAHWFLGMKDLVTQCQAQKITCTFYVGNAPFHP